MWINHSVSEIIMKVSANGGDVLANSLEIAYVLSSKPQLRGNDNRIEQVLQ